MELKIEESERTTLFAELHPYDPMAKRDEFIEVTEWTNGEGYDVIIKADPGAHFQISHGQFMALKKMIKSINA